MSTKQRILTLLENSRGQHISGGYIAEMLNISRNAVWKAVKELEKDGYKITAVTNKGYCLSDDNDILSVQGMLPFLACSDHSERIILYKSLESTNKTAKEMAISNAEHGTVVLSDYQTAGRGRYDRQFYSPAGCGIYMSLILYPKHLYFVSPTLLTIFAAVSVCEAIEDVSQKKPRIKWVNDIFLDGKKICGILTEAVTDYESGNMQWAVIGIGINFSTPAPCFPENLQPIAGSVFPNGSQSITRNQLAAEIINRILGHTNQSNEKEILDKYKKRLMMLGEKILVVHGQKTYSAVALDINDAGHLIVEKENGEILSLSAGEISVLIPK